MLRQTDNQAKPFHHTGQDWWRQKPNKCLLTNHLRLMVAKTTRERPTTQPTTTVTPAQNQNVKETTLTTKRKQNERINGNPVVTDHAYHVKREMYLITTKGHIISAVFSLAKTKRNKCSFLFPLLLLAPTGVCCLRFKREGNRST